MENDAGVLEPGQRCQLLPGESSITIEALQSATRQPMTLKEAEGMFRVVSGGENVASCCILIVSNGRTH